MPDVNIGFIATSMKGSSTRTTDFRLARFSGAHTAYNSAANTARKYRMEKITTITSSHVTSCAAHAGIKGGDTRQRDHETGA